MRLLASDPCKQRRGSAASIAASLAFHTAIAAGLVWATLAAGVEPEDEEELTILELAVAEVVPPPPPPPPDAPPPPEVADLPRGFQVLETPVVVPPEIPPPGQEIREEDYTGQGIEGGVGDGDPLTALGDELDNTFRFTQATVLPRCKVACTADDILRHLPPLLEKSGVQCELTVGIRIDTGGNVTATDMLASSGNPGCDQAAEEWARTTRWTTAYNRDQPVVVWIAQPVRITQD